MSGNSFITLEMLTLRTNYLIKKHLNDRNITQKQAKNDDKNLEIAQSIV
jgi:hypothetical protein